MIKHFLILIATICFVTVYGTVLLYVNKTDTKNIDTKDETESTLQVESNDHMETQTSYKKEYNDYHIVFIGDSRFVGTANLVRGLSYENNECIASIDNETWICKVGTSLNQYETTVLSQLQQFESEKEDTILVYELGVNNPGAIENDIEFVDSLISNGWTVYQCDLLPIVDSKFSGTLSDTDVQEANQQIENSMAKHIHFHDTCLNTYQNETNDGLHYGKNTYEKWYETIITTIRNDLNE